MIIVSYSLENFLISWGILFIKMDKQTIIKISKPILKKHRIEKAALFGSIVRGKTRIDSDIDMLEANLQRRHVFMVQFTHELKNWHNHRKNQYLQFYFSFHLPNPRKERIIVERDELGRIVHSQPPQFTF